MEHRFGGIIRVTEHIAIFTLTFSHAFLWRALLSTHLDRQLNYIKMHTDRINTLDIKIHVAEMPGPIA